jgi:hypothetical protein
MTGLLEIELISYLLRDGSHLLQQLRILLISAVGGYPASDYLHRGLRQVGLMKANICFGIDLAMCFTYAASLLGASLRRSARGAILGPPG